MIAVDTNILVYAHREDSPFHEIAFERLAELGEGPGMMRASRRCVASTACANCGRRTEISAGFRGLLL